MTLSFFSQDLCLKTDCLKSERFSSDLCPMTEMFGNKTKVERPRTEYIRISDVDCIWIIQYSIPEHFKSGQIFNLRQLAAWAWNGGQDHYKQKRYAAILYK